MADTGLKEVSRGENCKMQNIPKGVQNDRRPFPSETVYQKANLKSELQSNRKLRSSKPQMVRDEWERDYSSHHYLKPHTHQFSSMHSPGDMDNSEKLNIRL
jgi:hypothetical protein